MANTRFAYVRHFEQASEYFLPRDTWLVIRVDGRGFSRFTQAHNYVKPNDVRGIQLMNRAAMHVAREFNECCAAYGQSDEYSFVLHKSTQLYSRRLSKIASSVSSAFSSAFVFHWAEYFPTTPLQYPPAFDSRVVSYPTVQHVRDYFSWRQADCHINNLYNTCFWALVQQGGMTPPEAEARLDGTFSNDKNELLYSQFGINYNTLSAVFRKGTFLAKEEPGAFPADAFLPGGCTDLLPWPANDQSVEGFPVSPLAGAGALEASVAGLSVSPSEQEAGEVTEKADDTAAAMSSSSTSHLKGRALRRALAKEERKQRKAANLRKDFHALHIDIIGDNFWATSATPGTKPGLGAVLFAERSADAPAPGTLRRSLSQELADVL
ncbi:tRNA(His) guanylyltransferase [Fonticula alba]|uniref:tRNA(His) guanylyltransferase n=1 Tax=Fonticula alba TaxID=691883 RepID=A0A058Z9I0_FONAL|nr:tRNA(His) guanylyltransferase [Fonticula alba]KCV70766.1 tRNA(His) guanylyltransferase [Fonticula alba]|eukprot:XP_009495282.1 tRNA(His) guanylyltransferase [Fonticula alba]